MANPDPDRLTIRERRLLDAVLSGEKYADAYKTAGYKCKSRAKARTSAEAVLSRPRVKVALAKAQAANRDKSEITQEQIVNYLGQVVFTPIGKVDESSILCQEYYHQEGEIHSSSRYKMVSKMDAIKHLTLLLGLEPPQKVEIDAADPIRTLLAKIRSR